MSRARALELLGVALHDMRPPRPGERCECGHLEGEHSPLLAGATGGRVACTRRDCLCRRFRRRDSGPGGG